MDSQKSTIVGIDLGTSFSAIAHINNDTHKAEIIPSPEQERILPSVVLIENESDVIVGEIAKQNAVAEPGKVVEFVKRQMGKPKEDKKDEKGNVIVRGWCFKHGGKKYSAQEISAFILKKLKNDAEARLGITITDAVITCPAYFGDPERAATKEAGIIAGFRVLAVMDEPVAAALSYGLDKAGKDQKVFVFDLGGGTFDVVILETKEGMIREIVVNGDHMLGGKDWDDEIIRFVAGEFREKHKTDPLDDVSVYQDLQLRAIRAKEELSKRDKTKIMCVHAGNTLMVELTKEKFEELTKSLVDRCKILCEIVLSEAKMTWKDIDTVLLVGGSTRMPMIRKMVTDISGKIPNEELNPDECVALGAAWHGATLGAQSGIITGDVAKRLTGIQVQKVSSHNLGIIAMNSNGAERNYLMIPRFAPLPSEEMDLFKTAVDNQQSALIRVTEGGIMGEDGTCDPMDCNMIASGAIENIPPAPKDSLIEVNYRYNDNGILEVQGKHVSSGRGVKITVEHTGSLTDQELQEASRDIGKTSITG
ncbi:MAG: Hsp70 family protein [Candidatus Brocadiaceae bacterium]|nr:Hsp70 family protein [Candidatus Brocadiaceae bacterium]